VEREFEKGNALGVGYRPYNHRRRRSLVYDETMSRILHCSGQAAIRFP
jgi:hypothetical protein